jgi:hypothetical protein
MQFRHENLDDEFDSNVARLTSLVGSSVEVEGVGVSNMGNVANRLVHYQQLVEGGEKTRRASPPRGH